MDYVSLIHASFPRFAASISVRSATSVIISSVFSASGQGVGCGRPPRLPRVKESGANRVGRPSEGEGVEPAAGRKRRQIEFGKRSTSLASASSVREKIHNYNARTFQSSTMSTRYTRPRRTKMYDCNYNMSERYYKPMVDHLDRKYSTAPSLDREIRDIPRHFSPLADGRRRDKSPSLDARRRPMSMLEEFEDDITSNRYESQSRSRAAAEEERIADDEMAASMKRIQASRAARAALEDEITELSTTRSQRKALGSDYSSKVLDSVGLKSGVDIEKTRISLEDEPFFKRRVLKLTTADDDEESGLTKWTALKGRRQHNEDLVEDEAGPTALMRARQSRNRLADLDAEMELVADRTAAREKRNNHLRALVQENSENSSDALTSSLRVKKTTIRSEKKTVTF